MEKRFDIIPHETGWIYVIDGQPSASFPCYDLALNAASAHADRELETLRRPIFRRLAVSGEMIPVSRPGNQHPL